MKGLPRAMFDRVVKQHEADKHSKGFRSWDQLVAMICAQVSASRSLRELETGFNSQGVHHYHLGTREIKRSTLADANRHRDVAPFAEVCAQLMQKAHRGLKKEMTDLLYLLDSTPIPLKGFGYEWALEKHNHRTHGLKVHVVFAPQKGLPVNARITPANVNDVEIGREVSIEPGATYVLDKGYYDYNWWYRIHQQGACFVTRFKRNAGLNLDSAKALSEEEAAEGILEDAEVSFKNKRPGGQRINHNYGTRLGRVVVDRPDKDSALVLVTNDVERSATEIAQLYKQRWGIELFFIWLKQSLKIKSFLGRSENAVRMQIYTALISYLLAHLCHRKDRSKHSLKLWLVE